MGKFIESNGVYTFYKYVSIRESKGFYILGGGKNKLIFDKQKSLMIFESLLHNTPIYIRTKYEKAILSELKSNNYITNQINKDFYNSRLFNFFKSQGINIQDQILKKTSILVLGAGGGGGTVVYYLSQVGIGKIKCIDIDKVEISDVEKTSIYRREDVGKYKTKALKEIINKNFPKVNFEFENKYIEGENFLEETISNYNPDIIINAIDPEPLHKLTLNKICVKRKIPLLFIAYSYESLILGPFLSFKKPICYNSFHKYVKKTSNNIIDYNDLQKIKFSGNIHPSTLFNVNILSSLALKEVILYISRSYSKMLSHNGIVFFNVMTLESSKLELYCNTECECNHYIPNKI